MQRLFGFYRDSFGRPISGGTVTVYQAGTSTLATLYQQGGDATNPQGQSNPITTDANGFWAFAAPFGTYDIQIQGANAPTYTFNNYQLANVNAAGFPSLAAIDISFLQTGTGAVNTTVDAKLRDWVSVKDFNAKGDGVTDDSIAINNALATGRAVFFPKPASFYNVTQTLIFNSNQILWGEGHTDSIIKNITNANPVIQAVNAGNGRTLRFLIKDLAFYSNVLNTTRVVDLRGCSYFKLENVQVLGDYLSTTNIGGWGIDVSTDTTSDQNQFAIFDNVFESYCSYGMRGKMNTINIYGGAFSHNTHYGIALVTGNQTGSGRGFRSLGVTITGTDLSANHQGSYNTDVARVANGQTITANGAANTYTRAAGSFLADGFAIGQEIRVAGFPTAQNNGVATVTFVDALNLTVDKALVTETTGALTMNPTYAFIKSGDYGGGAWIIGTGIRVTGCYHELNGGRVSGVYSQNDIEIDPSSTFICVTNNRWDYGTSRGKIHGDQEDVGIDYGSGNGSNQTGTYNLVPNGNFDNVDGSSVPLGWVDSGGVLVSYGAIPDSANTPPGHSNGLRATWVSGNPRLYYTLFATTADCAKYAGRWLVMSGYIRSNVTGGGMAARAGFATGAGGAINSATDAYVAAEGSPNKWIKYTVRYQITGLETTISCVPYLMVSGAAGTIDFMGVSVNMGESAFGNSEQAITSAGGDIWTQNLKIGGTRRGWGTAVPASGTWAVGDWVQNTTPSSGTSIFGWICTGAGTPGTWRAVGGVAADSVNPYNTTFNFDTSSNLVQVGAKSASSGNGGRIVIRNDTGATAWLAGLLGSAAATSYVLYDNANSRQVLTLTVGATGTATWAATRNIMAASTTTQAGLTLTPGAAPSAPNNGDVWQDSTTFAMTYRANSATQILLSTAQARASATAASPAGTTSLTAVMMAIGGAITPVHTTKVLVVVSGQMANSTVNDGAAVQLRFGTGTAPVNGAAVTGTQVGATQTHTSLVAADTSGWCISGVITGLTPGTAIWVDAALNAVTAGTATITGVSISLVEI